MTQNQRWRVFQLVIKIRVYQSKRVEITAVQSPKNVQRQTNIKYKLENRKRNFRWEMFVRHDNKSGLSFLCQQFRSVLHLEDRVGT